MKYIIIILLILTVIIALAILFMNSYNDLMMIKVKLDKASKEIDEKVKNKYEIMKKMSSLVSKAVKKKDYLKDFNSLKLDDYELCELDNELNKHLDIMINMKDDYKSLNTKEYKDLIKEINKLDEKLIASEKYFNKQNNALVKKLTGFNKIVAKFMKLKIETSYEIKEPIND